MFLDPNKLSEASPAEILQSAAAGHLGLDRRFIRALLSRPEESQAAAVALAAGDDSQWRVDLTPDLLALFRQWNTPDAIPFLIELIRHDPEHILDEVTEILVNLGPAALEPLLALYKELPEEDSGEVAFTLASLRVRDTRILDALLNRLEFDLTDGAFLLGIYGDPAALPKLDEVISNLPDSEAELRSELDDARDAITSGRSTGAQGPVVEDEPFDVYSLYPETADLPLDLLDEDERTELLSHPIAAVRAAAANSFFNRELNETQIRILLHLAQADESPTVRARAWESLSLVTEESKVVEAMLAALRKPDLDIEERGGLVVGLAPEADRNEVRTAVNQLYEVPAGRAKAMEAMWRSMHPGFRDRFAKHLNDPEIEVRRAAVWGIGYYGLRSELDSIRKLFLDEDLRSDALFAYTLALPGEVSRGRVKTLLARIEKDAHGLTEMEEELVKTALDEKLMLAGKEPFFTQQED